MAAKNEQGSFGYDPLAWMNEQQVTGESAADGTSEGEPEVTKTDEKQSETEPVKGVQQLDDAAASVDKNSEESSEQNDKINMTLKSVLNIQSVNHLYEQLEKTLQHHHIEIDASNVSSIDTANLQLLVVFKQEAVKMHKQVVFDFPSDRFIEAAELLDLSEMLDIDSPAAGLF